MSNSARAEIYYNKLLASSNIKSDLSIIINEINNLVYFDGQKALSKAEKLLIIHNLTYLIELNGTKDSFNQLNFDDDTADSHQNIDIIKILRDSIS